MGRLLINVQLPDSASRANQEVIAKATKIILDHDERDQHTRLAGRSFVLECLSVPISGRCS